ncbi:MAG TPA: PilZ domain-containing protein [Vicinamibacterales bacterium]|nr:PilZ domain-containing protein [Vicinamibacterales bacterium]
MGPELTVIVGDASRLAAIRTGVQFPGRAMHFTTGNVTGAMESIRAYRPKLVAIDAIYAQTADGIAFADRVEALGVGIRLIVRQDGKWATTGRPVQAAPAAPPVIAGPANTRRAPRFRLRAPLDAVVESGHATLVNLSIHGAQVVSHPVLRPNQRVKVGLSDDRERLDLSAKVAWSCFEKLPSAAEPHYRVGLEFADAARQMLDEYLARYCSADPIPGP